MDKTAADVPNTQQLFAQFLASQGLPEKGLKEATGGTTRNVVDLGPVVAKVAKDPKGIQQNDAELDNAPMTPKAVAAGKDFVITEKAQRNDKLIGQWLKPLKEFDSEDYDNKNPELLKTMKMMGLGSFLKYPLLWGDFTASRNWGIDQNGQPTLLDKGTLNSHIYDHNQAPEKVQDEYGKIEEERKSIKKSYKYNGT